jgi:disulfide bond formation protein DsbB
MHDTHPFPAPTIGTMDATTPSPSAPRGPGWPLALLAAAGAAGSLALSLLLGLRACPLCFYQRAFALAAFSALVLGATSRAAEARLLAARAAATAACAGLLVAGFHVALEARGALECPAGLLGAGSAPQRSLAFFLVLTVACGVRVARSGARGLALPGALAAVLGVASLAANPPPPPAPAQAYAEAPVVCRPPFRPAPR